MSFADVAGENRFFFFFFPIALSMHKALFLLIRWVFSYFRWCWQMHVVTFTQVNIGKDCSLDRYPEFFLSVTLSSLILQQLLSPVIPQFRVS